jgi:hypothetical protein
MEAVQNKSWATVRQDELLAVDGGNPALVAGGGLVAIAASPPLLETAAAVGVGAAVGLGLGALYDKFLRKHFEGNNTSGGNTGAEEHETPGTPE